jgi:hypothetical protein
MAIRAGDTPDGAVETVERHLSELAARPHFRGVRRLQTVDPTDVALSAPHAVYHLGLDQLSGGAGLDTAEPVADRFLVMGANETVASAELARGGGFQATEGPYAEATAAAIRAAEASPELADGNYELRVLRIPGIYLMAVWLKDEDGDGDVVIPLEPAPQPLEAGRHYSPADLLAELETLAKRRLEFDDTPEG